MTDIVALDAQRSLPEHVPPELVYDYPLTVANKTYENPHEVRLDRGPQHDAFGFGPHRCVGMHLARRELHCALEEFLKAIPQFRIAEGATIVSTLGPMIQPQTLPLVWSAT